MTTNTHFKARVNNGKIEIPVEYQDEIHSAEMVQIVILEPVRLWEGYKREHLSNKQGGFVYYPIARTHSN